MTNKITLLTLLLTFTFFSVKSQVQITWADLIGSQVDNTNNNLIATAIGWGYVGAASAEVLPQNKSWTVSMQAEGLNPPRAMGVSHENENAHINTIEYMVYLLNGNWYYKTPLTGYVSMGAFTDNDHFSLSYNSCSNEFTFTRFPSDNSAQVSISVDATLTTDMIVDVAMYGGTSDALLKNVLISIDELEYNNEDAYITNAQILQEKIDQTPNGGVLNLNSFDCGVLFIDAIYITKDITINGNDITLKRPIILEENPATLKWHRLFTVHNSNNEHHVTLNDLNFDGSLLEMDVEYLNHEIEHSSLLFLNHDQNSTNEGSKLTAIVNNCTFKSTGGGGAVVFKNVDFTMTDSEAHDCFVGGLVCTGGNSTIVVENFQTYGNSVRTGVDFEVNPPDADGNGGSPGNNNRFNLDVTLSNITLDADLDIAVLDGTTFYGDNVTLLNPPFTINGELSEIEFNNSTFRHDYSTQGRILWPHKITFNNSAFIAVCTNTPNNSNDGIVSACPVIAYWVSGKEFNEGEVNFNLCDFSSTCQEDYTKIGVVTQLVKEENNVALNFNSCTFDESLDVGFSTYTSNGICAETQWLSAGCNFNVKNSTFNSKLGFWAKGNTTYPVDIDIRNSVFNNDEGVYFFDGLNNLSTNNIQFKCVDIIGSPNLYSGDINSTQTSIKGNNIIYISNGLIDHVDGMKGDILNYNGNLYICEVSGFRHTSLNLSPCENLQEPDFTRIAPTWTYLGGQEIIVPSNSCNIEFSTCLDAVVSAIKTPATESNLGALELVFNNNWCDYTHPDILWDNRETSLKIEDLLPGEYCVTIKSISDDEVCADCFTKKCFIIEGTNCPPFIEDINVNISHSSCGTADGTIDLNMDINNECTDVTYEWSNGEKEKSISDLSPGEYCVTATLTPKACTEERGIDCYFVECFRIRSKNSTCETNHCYSNIKIDEEIHGIEITEPGWINVQVLCAPVQTQWKYNNDEITNFDPSNIIYPGEYCLEYVDIEGCKGEICFEIGYCTKEDCTYCDQFAPGEHGSSSRSSSDQIVEIYPIPFSDYLEIKSDYKTVKAVLFDVTGNKIISKVLDISNGQSISTSNLTSGIYILEIIADGVVVKTQKVIKTQ